MLRAAFFSFAIVTATAPAAASPLITGIAHARDGDSLEVGGKEIRLFGVDAPEYDQTCKRDGQTWACGAEAAKQLARLVTGKKVYCSEVSTDEYRRAVSRCSTAAGDVNAAMVESGYATAYRHYSSDYVPAEERAKAAKRGIWAGTFTAPSEYRHAQDAPPRSSAPRTSRRKPAAATPRSWANRGDCRIKGNRNRKGQWIYHVPGMPYYDQTRPEQIFCTEAEAQAAGYRRAIVRK
jgi:endonuclease YncB( thermonuclease family)